MSEPKPSLDPDFAAAFRDGEAMFREWIAGRGDLPDLLHIVRDMPRGAEMGGLEAGFITAIDAAVRGDRRGEAGAPDPAHAQELIAAAPSSEALPPINMDQLYRRRRELERAAILDRFGRLNQQAFLEQQEAFASGNLMRNDWRWWR